MASEPTGGEAKSARQETGQHAIFGCDLQKFLKTCIQTPLLAVTN
jgi:hypothetical protein